MSEVNAPPTTAEVQAIRGDVENYLTGTYTLADYTAAALAQFKLDCEDKRGFKFSQVFSTTDDAYLVDTSSDTRNLRKIRQDLLCYLTVSKVFRDYAIATAEETDSRWWDLSNEYESRYEDRLKIARLDIDVDEDGSISEGEEQTSGQKFMVR
jgi:hypothetical protein